MSTRTIIAFIFLVVFLAVTIPIISNPEARGNIIETLNYIINKVRCIFGVGCLAGNDDQIAKDSAQALACAVDTTAYWSSNPADALTRFTIIDDCNKGTKTGDFCKGADVFTKSDKDKLASIDSCALSEKGGTTTAKTTCTPGQCTPASAKAGERQSYCNPDKTQKDCGIYGGDPAHPVCKAGTGCLEVKCSDCKSSLIDACPKEECTAISKTVESFGYGKCKFTEGFLLLPNDCKLDSTAPQAYEKSVDLAEKIVSENPRKATRFGQAAVVCNAYVIEDPKCCRVISEVSLIYEWRSKKCDEVYEVPVDDAFCGELPKPEFSCQVKQFELPQYVKVADEKLPWVLNLPLTAIDIYRAWIGFTADPKYLVYYEKFPEEAEAWWTYGELDPVWSVFAIGAVSNTIVGTTKVGWAATKAVKKYGVDGTLTFIAKRSISETDRALLTRELKVSVAKSIADNFGGKAISKYVRALQTEETLLGDVIKDGINEAYKKRMLADAVTSSPRWAEIKSADYAMTDFAHAIQGGGTIDREFVEDVFKRSGKTITPEGASLIVDDLNTMKGSLKLGPGEVNAAMKAKLANDAAKKAYKEQFMNRFRTNMRIYEEGMSVVNPDRSGIIGVIPGLSWVANKIAGKKSLDEALSIVDDDAMASFARVENAIKNSGESMGDNVFGYTEAELSTADAVTKDLIRKNILSKSEAELLANPAKADVDRMIAAWYLADTDEVFKSSVRKRAEYMLKGFAGLPPEGWPSWKRVALMSGTYVSAMYFMQNDYKAEKYFVQQKSLTLYRAGMLSWLYGDNPKEGENYLVRQPTEGVKSDTWVEMKIPAVFGDGGMPIALASPCKADIDVSYGTDCICKDYAGSNEVLIRYTTAECRWKIDEEGVCAPKVDTEGKPICDPPPLPEYTTPFYTAPIVKKYTLPEGVVTFPPVLGECKYLDVDTGKWVYVGTLKGGVCEYEPETLLEKLIFIDPTLKSTPSGCKTRQIMNVGAANDGSEQVYKMCTEEGKVDWFATMTEPSKYKFNCVKVKIAEGSMSKYKDESKMDENFCRVNNAKLIDYAVWFGEGSIFVVSTALSAAPPTMVVGEAVSFVGGGLLALGWRQTTLDKLWPTSQI